MRRLFVFVFIGLFAHNVAFSMDVDFAKELESINELAKDDFEGFLLGLNNSFGVKKSKIKKMMAEHKMKPSDVFMALKLSSVTERLLDEVIKSFRENRGKGWGVIAKRMGIKPGSREFHELKASSRDFAKGHKKKNQGKSKKKGHGKGKKKGYGKGKKNR